MWSISPILFLHVDSAGQPASCSMAAIFRGKFHVGKVINITVSKTLIER